MCSIFYLYIIGVCIAGTQSQLSLSPNLLFGSGGSENDADVLKSFINTNIPEITIDKAAIDEYLLKAIACKNVAALSLAIVQLDDKDQVIRNYTNAFGIRNPADPSSGRPTSDTRFCIGSVTKQVTVGVLGTILTENGRGDDFGDIPLNELLPRDQWKLFTNDSLNEIVTLRDLLAHRTGIHRFDVGWIFGQSASRNQIWDNIHWLTPELPQSKTFRSEYVYNNWMFALAGHIAVLEYAKSHPEHPLTYEELVEKYIFKPLKMDTATFLEPGYGSNDFAEAGYYHNSSWYPSASSYYRGIMYNIAPAGSICASAVDMTKYLAHLLSQTKDSPGSVPRSVIRQQFAPSISMPLSGVPTFAPFLPTGYTLDNYGLGFMLGHYRDYRIIEHSGDLGEYTTAFWTLPDMRTGVFLSTTHSFLDPAAVMYPALLTTQLVDLLVNRSAPWLPIDDFCKPGVSGLVPEGGGVLNLTGYDNECFMNGSTTIMSYLGEYRHPLFGNLTIDFDPENGLMPVKYGSYGQGYLCSNPFNEEPHTFRYIVDPNGPVFLYDIPLVNVGNKMNITIEPQFGVVLAWFIEPTMPTPVTFNRVKTGAGFLKPYKKLDLERLKEVEALKPGQDAFI